MSAKKKTAGPWLRTDEKIRGKSVVIIRSEGRGRWVWGEGGGRLFFDEDGSVTVQWNRSAALAADYGKGRRDARLTTATGSRKAAAVTPAFEFASFWRAIGREAEAAGDPFSADYNPETWGEKNTKGAQAAAWELMVAVLHGDHAKLAAIAGALKSAEELATGDMPLTLRRWQEVADAIGKAAKDRGDVPDRSEVAEVLRPIREREQGTVDLRDELARMGFGWLPAPGGRPGKKVD